MTAEFACSTTHNRDKYLHPQTRGWTAYASVRSACAVQVPRVGNLFGRLFLGFRPVLGKLVPSGPNGPPPRRSERRRSWPRPGCDALSGRGLLRRARALLAPGLSAGQTPAFGEEKDGPLD